MMRSFTYIIIFIQSVVLFAQTGQGEIRNAEFIIEKERELTLPVMPRKFFPVESSTLTAAPDFNISLGEFDYEVPVMSRKVENNYIVSTEEKKPEEHHYVRGGLGTLISPLIEYSYNSNRYNSDQWGGYFFHDSFLNGAVRDQESGMSDTDMNIWGFIRRPKIKLRGRINYERNGYQYYGLTDSLYQLPKADSLFELDRQSRNSIGTSFTLKGNLSKFNYEVNPSWKYTWLSTGSGLSENLAGVETKLGFDFTRGFSVETNISAWYSGVSSYTAIDRSWLTFNPRVRIEREYLRLIGGLKLIQLNHNLHEDRLSILPDVHVLYRFSTILHGFLTLNGGIEDNTLYQLSDRNYFLNDSLNLLNTVNTFNLEGGVKGYIMDGLSGYLSMQVYSTDPKLLYLNDSINPSQFNVVYDSSFSAYRLKIGLNYKSERGFEVDTDQQLNLYTTSQQEEAWHLPEYELRIHAKQQISQFEVGSSILFMSGIKSLAVENQEVINISPIFNLGINISYSISPQGKVFLSLNNVLNQNNERYYLYPTIPFFGRIGGSYRF